MLPQTHNCTVSKISTVIFLLFSDQFPELAHCTAPDTRACKRNTKTIYLLCINLKTFPLPPYLQHIPLQTCSHSFLFSPLVVRNTQNTHTYTLVSQLRKVSNLHNSQFFKLRRYPRHSITFDMTLLFKCSDIPELLFPISNVPILLLWDKQLLHCLGFPSEIKTFARDTLYSQLPQNNHRMLYF